MGLFSAFLEGAPGESGPRGVKVRDYSRVDIIIEIIGFFSLNYFVKNRIHTRINIGNKKYSPYK